MSAPAWLPLTRDDALHHRGNQGEGDKDEESTTKAVGRKREHAKQHSGSECRHGPRHACHSTGHMNSIVRPHGSRQCKQADRFRPHTGGDSAVGSETAIAV